MTTILCCHSPHFLFNISAQAHPTWQTAPVALLGPDERIWATSKPARESGVASGLTARQARTRCPDVDVQELNMEATDAAQAAFASVLTQTGLPVEIAGHGLAHCDLSLVSTSLQQARPLCADLGQQLRRTLGPALQPALGCDHGKFTASAAANIVQPGRLRLVDEADQARFLAPLAISLLPLPFQVLQQLVWLGLTTLADFARLPATSVVQRWGKVGKLAHAWAQGRDVRPVWSTQLATPEPIQVDFEVPCEQHDEAFGILKHALVPAFDALGDQLRGCQKLQVQLRFVDHSTRVAVQRFARPILDLKEIGGALSRLLSSHTWPTALVQAQVLLQEMGELQPVQLSLLGEAVSNSTPAAPFDTLLAQLGRKYSATFYAAHVSDPAHPISERRVTWQALAI